MASHALAGSCRRRAASEGSLPPMGRAALVLSGSGGAVREGKSMSAYTRAVGEVWGVILKVYHESIRRRYSEGQGGIDGSRGYE